MSASIPFSNTNNNTNTNTNNTITNTNNTDNTNNNYICYWSTLKRHLRINPATAEKELHHVIPLLVNFKNNYRTDSTWYYNWCNLSEICGIVTINMINAKVVLSHKDFEKLKLNLSDTTPTTLSHHELQHRSSSFRCVIL